jgi:hypothetical protein
MRELPPTNVPQSICSKWDIYWVYCDLIWKWLAKALIVSTLSPTNIGSLVVNILDSNNTTACSFSHRQYQLSVVDTNVISLLKLDPITAWTVAAILWWKPYQSLQPLIPWGNVWIMGLTILPTDMSLQPWCSKSLGCSIPSGLALQPDGTSNSSTGEKEGVVNIPFNPSDMAYNKIIFISAVLPTPGPPTIQKLFTIVSDAPRYLFILSQAILNPACCSLYDCMDWIVALVNIGI